MDKTKSKRLKTSNENEEMANQNLLINTSNQLLNEQNDLIIKRYLRDKIINNLIEFNALLCGETMTEDVQKRMLEDNQELALSFINLKLNQTNSTKTIDNDSTTMELVFYLNRTIRLNLIDNLINNCIIFSGVSISNENKTKLKDENNQLITQLLTYPSKLVKVSMDLKSLTDDKEVEIEEIVEIVEIVEIDEIEEIDKNGKPANFSRK